MSNRVVHGWMYHTDGVPKYIIVRIAGKEETFPASQDGAVKASEYVNTTIDRNDWKLELVGFLGYRIVTGAE